jgi:hypothetical protein
MSSHCLLAMSSIRLVQYAIALERLFSLWGTESFEPPRSVLLHLTIMNSRVYFL